MTTTDLQSAHDASSNHRSAVESSRVCGCFYCLHVFASALVTTWVGRVDRALCPMCGIDSVIPDNAGFALTPEFLANMHERWFVRGEDDEV